MHLHVFHCYLVANNVGRTGRIGHRGLATSFYCERDEPIASVLTRTLLETKQDVPDFLEQYIPEGDARTNLKFEADSDFDENDVAGAGDAGTDNPWGTGAGGDDDTAAGGDPWGNAGNGDVAAVDDQATGW